MSSNSIHALGQPIGQSLTDWMPPAFPPHHPMKGQFCQLEPLNSQKHAQDLFKAKALDEEGRNWTYLPYGPFTTFEAYRDWMDSVSVNVDPQFYAVIDIASRKPVGVASYLRITPDTGSIEVGHIHFSKLAQRHPSATEAMFLMMKRAFELGYRRYEWKCDALNTGSCSAAQRLGLSFEGVFRQATIYKERNRDTAWFAAIDTEWPLLEKAFTQWLDPSNFDQEGWQQTSLRHWTQPILKKEFSE
ncbi:MAG: RimJ/RimL family protein N-acetyltransferase [Verrucomicrobiales bacterium]|jgi:RimJ/RimL family protein N-acetyltransferase